VSRSALVVVPPLPLLVPMSSCIGGVWPVLVVVVIARWWCWGLLVDATAVVATIGGWWWWWYMGLVLLV